MRMRSVSPRVALAVLAAGAAAAAARPCSGDPPDIAVYAGYYDTHHEATNPKPNPWKGSPNVVFVGTPDPGTSNGWDTSAIRVDNLEDHSITVTVTVDIGPHHFALWGSRTVPAGQSLILAQTAKENFDGSDTNPAGCYTCHPNDCLTMVLSTVPVVHVTVDGTTVHYYDPGQVLNTDGVDAAGCPYTGMRNDESAPWTQLFTGTLGVGDQDAPRGRDPGVWLSLRGPNPTRGDLEVRFGIAEPGEVHLAVFDVAGRLEMALRGMVLEPGQYQQRVNLRGLSAGVHFFRVITDEAATQQAFTLLP